MFIGSTLADYSVTSSKIATNAIQEYHLAAASVLNSKLADSSVTSNKLVSGSVYSVHLVDNNVTSGKLAANSVYGSNIVNATIGPDDIAPNAVQTSALTNFSVTMDKVGTNSIGPWALTNDAVTTAAITNGAVTSNKIATATIGTNLLTTNVVFGLPKAWAVFDVNAAAMLKGFNVASVTVPGTAQYQFNFGVAFTSTNYCVMASSGRGTAGNELAVNVSTNATGFVVIHTQEGGGSAQAPALPALVYLTVFDF